MVTARCVYNLGRSAWGRVKKLEKTVKKAKINDLHNKSYLKRIRSHVRMASSILKLRKKMPLVPARSTSSPVLVVFNN